MKLASGDGISEAVEATVIGIMIQGIFNNDVQYRCSWWNDKARIAEWIEGCEVHAVEDTTRQTIEFKEQ